MARRGENIYHRKDGRWEARCIQHDVSTGKKHYKYVYGKTYTEVKAKAKAIPLIVEKHEKRNSLDRIQYGEILRQWLSSTKNSTKESTYAKYCHHVRRHLFPDLGSVLFENLDTETVDQYIDHLLESGRLDGAGGLSPKTVADILSIIKASIRYAVSRGHKTSCLLDAISVKKASVETNILTEEEENVLRTYLLSTVSPLNYGVLLALYTGIRIGEVCALRWEQLELDKGFLEIKWTLQRIQNTSTSKDGSTQKTKVIITEPKSDCSKRIIPLPKFLISHGQQLYGRPLDYVLTGEQRKYIEPRSLQNKFNRIIAFCGIKTVSFHSLRHTFATRCVERGVDIKSLSEILGHSSVSITLNRYVHSSFEQKKAQMNKVESFICQI